MKKVALASALVTLCALPALAQSIEQTMTPRSTVLPARVVTYPVGQYGRTEASLRFYANTVPQRPGAFIGADPDALVRLQLQIDSNE